MTLMDEKKTKLCVQQFTQQQHWFVSTNFSRRKHTPNHWFQESILINHFSRINTAKNFRHDFEMCINDIFFPLIDGFVRWQTLVMKQFFSSFHFQHKNRRSISIKSFSAHAIFTLSLSPFPIFIALSKSIRFGW